MKDYKIGYHDKLPAITFAKERKFVKKIREWYSSQDTPRVCALLGPLKVGKTFALSQIFNEYKEKAIYFDFKQHNINEQDILLDVI